MAFPTRMAINFVSGLTSSLPVCAFPSAKKKEEEPFFFLSLSYTLLSRGVPLLVTIKTLSRTHFGREEEEEDKFYACAVVLNNDFTIESDERRFWNLTTLSTPRHKPCCI